MARLKNIAPAIAAGWRIDLHKHQRNSIFGIFGLALGYPEGPLGGDE